MICCFAVSLAFAAPPTVVADGADFKSPKQPQLCVSSDGVIHLTFGDGNGVYYARSESVTPLKFSEAVKVADAPNLSLGMRRGPRIAASGKTIVISAIGGKLGKGRDGELFAWRSTDDGKSWQGPATVNDVPAAAREGLHAMAAGKDGLFACAWLDLRTKQTVLRVATSKDGAEWSPNTLAYEAPSGPICQCCHPSMAFDEKDGIHLLWRNLIDGDRDMYRAESHDGGKSFGDAVKLGRGAWRLNACPMDGGAFDVLNGRVVTAWRRERIVYATFGKDDAEVRLGSGEQPVIAATSSGAVVAWLDRRPGRLHVQWENDKSPKVIAEDANDPSMIATADRKRAILAWEAKKDGRGVIQAVVVGPEN